MADEAAPSELGHVAPGTPEHSACAALEAAWGPLNEAPPSRENSLAFHYLQIATMWAMRDLLVKHKGLDPKVPRLDPRATVPD